MKIVITGGTGQIGRILCRAFPSPEHEIVVLTRHPHLGSSHQTIWWDGKTIGPWTATLEGADIVINLAGRSVNCRYGQRNRQKIMDSRVNSVRVMGRALRQASRPPRLWLQAATATIYAHRFDAPNDEYSGIIGGDEIDAPETWRFSIAVAKAWEAAVDEVGLLPRTRTIVMRSAMTMSPDRGGIFSTLRALVRLGLGGKMGDGRQFISWIHEFDFVRVIRAFIEKPNMSGTINVCSPNPLPNSEFMRELRRACGMSLGLPARKWMLEIGAFFMRTETELILKSRRVIPRRLLENGFKFQFPEWQDAVTDLCRRYPIS